MGKTASTAMPHLAQLIRETAMGAEQYGQSCVTGRTGSSMRSTINSIKLKIYSKMFRFIEVWVRPVQGYRDLRRRAYTAPFAPPRRARVDAHRHPERTREGSR